MRTTNRELVIPSCRESMCQVEKFIEDICDLYYINNTYFGNVLLAIEEAVNNAILHGNKSDRNKKVIINFTAKPAGLSFAISDEGPGFDYRMAPNPLDADDRAAESTGRGLFLIRTLADETYFNSKGNKIEMLFRISSIHNETSVQRVKELDKYFQTKKSILKEGE